ncbi:hypothetical protein A2U01_0074942, partial [Trifolium medium]|nr:hypothetical protein [Trifolium medium]
PSTRTSSWVVNIWNILSEAKFGEKEGKELPAE